MKPLTRKELRSLHVSGYLSLAFQAFVIAWFGTATLHLLGISYGLAVPAGAVFGHLFLMLVFLGLFPGQGFWTIRAIDRNGQIHTVIGALTAEEIYHGRR